MNKHLKQQLLILLLLNCGLLNGQSYKSIFGNTKTIWNIAFEQITYQETDSLVTGGDTIINSMNYKIINQPTGYFFKFQKYYIREDTNSGKFFIRNVYEMQNEYLFMDLSLNIGDTFIIHNRHYFSPDSIAIVDSIYFINNMKVIKTNHIISIAGTPNNYLRFYESIGPSNGINYLFQEFGMHHRYSLLCQFKEDTLYFHNTMAFQTELCHLSDGGYISENSLNILKNVFPNPTNQVLNFNFYANITGTLSLSNLFGQVIMEQNIYDKSCCQLYVENLPIGLYLIKLITKNLELRTKFIKN